MLPVPVSSYSSAGAINNSGQIIGSFGDGTIEGTTYRLWNTDGSFIDLPNGFAAYQLSNTGTVVGEIRTTAAGPPVIHAAIWTAGSGAADLGTLSGSSASTGHGINSAGYVVGDSGSTPFVWNPKTGMTDLNTALNASGNGWTLEDAKGINDAGQIVGVGINAAGLPHALLLTPSALVQQAVVRTPTSSLITVPVPAASQLETFNAGTGHFVQGGSVNPTLPTVVLTPGFADFPGGWATSLAKQYPGAGQTVNIVAWNWQNDAGSLTNPSSLGLATSLTLGQGAGLGTALVTALGNNYNQSIHFIGHSLGTLVNAAAVNVFNSDTNDSARTQVTLLDGAEIADAVSPNLSLFSPIPASGALPV